MAKLHSGPLPAPEDYGHYEEVLPGSAARILAMAEKSQAMAENAQADSTRLAEKRIDGDLKEARRGQNYAFTIAMTGMAGGVVAALLGVPVAFPIALVGASLALVIAPFLRKSS